MDGHAENAPETLDSLAAFLEADTPDAGPDDQEERQPAQPGPDEDDGHPGAQNAAPDGDEEEGDDPDSEEQPDDQTSARKFKVTVKGEDGADQDIEVDEPELIKGYQRQSDYTRGMQGLAQREREAVQLVSTKLNEGRQFYLEQAQLARAAVLQLAGLKSPAEMAQLAASDQGAWVQEKQREEAVMSVVNALEQGVRRERQNAAAEAETHRNRSVAENWQKLSAQGIDQPKLIKVFETVSAKYGFKPEEFKGATDSRLILLMRDAAAYHALKDKKPEIQQKAQSKLPAAKQPVPKNERLNKEINQRFRGGRAKVDDLAAFIHANGI